MGRSTSQTIVLPTLPPEIAALADDDAFTGATSLALATRIMMAKHTRKLYEHLPNVLRGDDPHDIHQMRVATRRLRASLQSTAVAYRDKPVAALRKRLRRLARMLGAVRDLDVMLIRLRQDAAQPDIDHSEIDERIELLQTERHAAHDALIAELQHKRSARLLHALNDFLLEPLEKVQADDDGLSLLVRHHAGSAIWHEYEAVQRFETIMPHAGSERLHQLRIACKHLRYTLELFEPALGKGAHGVIKQVEAMQEHLGLIHDADVALASFGVDVHLREEAAPAQPTESWKARATTIEDHRPSDGAAQPALYLSDSARVAQEQPPAQRLRYVDMRMAERSRLLAAVEPMWRALTGDKTRRNLANVVAAL